MNLIETLEREAIDALTQDRPIPEVLRSGDHAKIAAWRHERALEDTRLRRPDLIERHGGASQAPPSGARRDSEEKNK